MSERVLFIIHAENECESAKRKPPKKTQQTRARAINVLLSGCLVGYPYPFGLVESTICFVETMIVHRAPEREYAANYIFRFAGLDPLSVFCLVCLSSRASVIYKSVHLPMRQTMSARAQPVPQNQTSASDRASKPAETRASANERGAKRASANQCANQQQNRAQRARHETRERQRATRNVRDKPRVQRDARKPARQRCATSAR